MALSIEIKVPQVPFARKCSHIFHNICEKLAGTGGGGDDIPQPKM